ncbi:MAG: rane fusion protein multidrug efflux system, partial [Bacteroidota bacterium]|nr:rane fusion protein multidrug efflux system [Bacteroidota bacterium]
MKYLNTFSAIMISVMLVSACSKRNKPEAAVSKDVAAASEKSVIPVRVITLTKTKIARTIDYTATILPFEEVNLVPSTPGRVEKIYVEVGDRVNKGDDLFLMDRTQLYQQKVQLESLAKDLSRLDTLLRSGSARQQQYDQIKTQYDVLKT